ncbi:uncharacterized protein LY79DRAFT_699859 [Colletotrichum navitas]|uniref:Uncharacterized protein n=1 Tax=Colletotrichum navitas TaxID=681940 RepID=A0AAD8QBZ8_9PEZI|nr:uncharacterized protein LY79DRAFT_699859 [Colletotrichum navitas]KAK1599186.1 hypothetical protein LY79DRAFT_699859 [Colletotrichum navitas]
MQPLSQHHITPSLTGARFPFCLSFYQTRSGGKAYTGSNTKRNPSGGFFLRRAHECDGDGNSRETLAQVHIHAMPCHAMPVGVLPSHVKYPYSTILYTADKRPGVNTNANAIQRQQTLPPQVPVVPRRRRRRRWSQLHNDASEDDDASPLPSPPL